jgi:hypothetical protein
VRYERDAATLDTTSSFWIACDESGQDGETLTSTRPVMSHGAVRLDDDAADAVVQDLRQRLPTVWAGELKFSRFDSPRTVSVLTTALRDPQLLATRCSAYIVDKRYMAVAKTIDLIIEEYEHERGNDIYSTGEAAALATDLLVRGPTVLDADLLDTLLSRFVSLFRMGEPGGRPRATVDELFESVAAAKTAARDQRVRSILSRIAAGREQVDYFITHIRGSGGLPHLQPLIPAVIETIRDWYRRVPGVLMVLHDRQNLLSDEMIADIRRGLCEPSPLISVMPAPVVLGTFVRGDSASHSSIQLADLVAGAGRVAGEYAMGRRTDPVAHQLSRAMRPYITEHSLWGDPKTWSVLTTPRY